MAQQKIQIKRSKTEPTAPPNMAYGELAYSEVSKKLFFGKENGSGEAIGGEGAFVTPEALGEAIQDALDNVTIDGGTY
jgi:hypothetical protein